ncbi:putative anthocyanidin reductase isoform X1 [Senna tora]|uniref:Putative anthocyanidin reductase isoform X1 n=1 Tax=Senna tora TaxID=362788 RepID=A0A834XJC9_9FABA|nr:putative anthocyanidin reductase isoform X1 [Senna tora]
MEVVTLTCGLVGGDTVQSSLSGSLAVCISHLTQNSEELKSLKFLEQLLGKIPLVHIDDVCEAHIFCMENPSITNGRFLCANSFVSSQEIANYYLLNYPEIQLKQQ